MFDDNCGEPEDYDDGWVFREPTPEPWNDNYRPESITPEMLAKDEEWASGEAKLLPQCVRAGRRLVDSMRLRSARRHIWTSLTMHTGYLFGVWSADTEFNQTHDYLHSLVLPNLAGRTRSAWVMLQCRLATLSRPPGDGDPVATADEIESAVDRLEAALAEEHGGDRSAPNSVGPPADSTEPTAENSDAEPANSKPCQPDTETAQPEFQATPRVQEVYDLYTEGVEWAAEHLHDKLHGRRPTDRQVYDTVREVLDAMDENQRSQYPKLPTVETWIRYLHKARIADGTLQPRQHRAARGRSVVTQSGESSESAKSSRRKD